MYTEPERDDELVIETWSTAGGARTASTTRPFSTAVDGSKRLRSPYPSLRSTAQVIEGLVWLYSVLGAIASVVVMTSTQEVDSSLLAPRSVHPFVGLGLALLLAVTITSAFLLLFSRWVAAWAYSRMH
jgi:hypothetical protein